MKQLTDFLTHQLDEALALNNIIDFSFLNTLKGVQDFEKQLNKYAKEEDTALEDIAVGIIHRLARFKKPIKVNGISVTPGIWLDHKTKTQYKLTLYIPSSVRKEKGIKEYKHELATEAGYKELRRVTDEYDISINDIYWDEKGEEVLSLLGLMANDKRKTSYMRLKHNKFVKLALKSVGKTLDEISNTEHYHSFSTYSGGKVYHDAPLCAIILYAIGKMLDSKIITDAKMVYKSMISGNRNVFMVSNGNKNAYIDYMQGDITHYGEDQRQLRIELFGDKSDFDSSIKCKKPGNIKFGDVSTDTENYVEYADDIINVVTRLLK